LESLVSVPTFLVSDAVPARFVTINRAAEITDLNVKTIRRLIGDGRLPSFKVAGTRSIRVSLDDLYAVLVPVTGK
jgi:excisionase family DNA binding protein